MTAATDFLFELLTEELPPKALATLEQSLRDSVVAQLTTAGFGHAQVDSFATPRRLALSILQLWLQAADQQVQRRGPPVSAALDKTGTPTRAGTAFAQSCGVEFAALKREQDAKGTEYLSFNGIKAGAQLRTVLPAILQQALDQLPIPKRMRWGDGEAQFVRPVHGLMVLLGDEVLDCKILDVASGRQTRGHRFMASGPITITHPAEYAAQLLREGKVIAGFKKRRERIASQVSTLAQTLDSAAGSRALMSDALLDEVTALVEWPVALAGRFEERFLELPRELLISVLQDHQRYFPVEDANGKLLPCFITLSNIESRNPEVVRAGNERVVRPRLSDAAFFWQQDRKTSLASRQTALDAVTFQAQLGSIGDKVRRIEALARNIAAQIGGDPELAARAAQLCKCDLVSNLVGEFPELQGIMGRYYAAADGEPAEVAQAVAEHYQPRGAGDALPKSRTGLAVALADRVDSLTGIFAIGQKPTGTKDPFALRRAAIGVLRMLRETPLSLDMVALIQDSLKLQQVSAAPAVADDVFAYVMERLRGLYLEPADGAAIMPGVTTEAFDAVLATQPRSPLDFEKRLLALLKFLKAPEAAALTAANKRIANLLRKSAGPLSEAGATTLAAGLPSIQVDKLSAPAEQALHRAVLAAEQSVPAQMTQGHYAAALTELAGLRSTVDQFFDDVMVMDPDPALRTNRLALLTRLRALFTGCADLSLLPG